jgi:hypothetical protein
MTDHNNKQGRSVAGVVTLAVVLSLPVLYVLSIGPALWMQEHGFLNDSDSVVRFYWPVSYLRMHCGIFDLICDWYMKLWVD